MPELSNDPLYKFGRHGMTVAIIWIGLVLYLECYWLFDYIHWTIPFADKLLFHFRDTGWLEPWRARSIILFCIGLSFLGPAEEKPAMFSRRKCLFYIGGGVCFYFGAPVVFIRTGDPAVTCAACIILTILGFYWIYTGVRQALRILRPMLSEDPYGRSKGGFPQEESRVASEFSLHIPAEYEYKGKKRDSWINLVNPRRGIFIVGSPGSGKSRFIIEPLLRQWTEKGQMFFLYDFKYDALTRLAWEYFGRYRSKFPANTEFFYINFTDLERSHRCNVLDPGTLAWFTDALGVARTILLGMNPSWVNQQGQFFVESPINFFAACIWWLKKHKGGQYCTLPHSIELAQLPYEKLFTLLNCDPEIQSVVNPFIIAYRNKTFEMLDGQISSAKIPLGRLASPNLYYILTGNDLSLVLNDPTRPRICCIGGDPTRQDALGPVISLYIDQVNTLCNRPGRLPLAIFCDEFATVRAYSMAATLATGRSNNMVPILAVQDLNQLRTRYSRSEADSFLNITGNLFCGQVGGETADWISKRFPRIQRERTAVSENSHDSSVNTSRQWEPTVTPALIANLSSGEFVGLVADDPGTEIQLKAFHNRLRRISDDNVPVTTALPVVREVTSQTAVENFEKVKQDILEITDEALEQIMQDRSLAGLIVRQPSRG